MNEGMKNQMESYGKAQHLLACQKCVSFACTCLNDSHLLIVMINSLPICIICLGINYVYNLLDIYVGLNKRKER
jgi:hypothetical protein